MSINSDDTQLTSAIGFDPTTMVFGEPQESNITLGDGKKIKFYRIPVGVKNPDGTVGELVFSTERLFSYGVQANTNDKTGEIDGYSAAICMWSRDGATQSQRDWIEGFNAGIGHAKDHVMAVKDQIEKYDLELSELKRFNPLYWKREKGKIVEGRGPTLYPKLICSRKENPPKILTPFEDEASGDDIDPKTLIGKYCYLTSAVKLESIFCGAKVSPQVKLHEAIAKLAQNRAKKLLRPRIEKQVKLLNFGDDVGAALGHVDSKQASSEDDDDDDDDSGSLQGSEDDDEEEQSKSPPKKVVKKRIVKKRVVRKKKA